MAEQTAMRNNACPYPVYGAPWAVVYPLLDADGDLVTGATTPDAEVSLNGNTFADCTNESVEIATNSGMYYLLLTAAEMTADVVAVIAKSATAGMKTTPLTFYPRKLVSIRAGTSASAGSLTASIVLDASASAIDDFYNGMLCVAVIDTLTEARIISDYTGSTQTATVVPDWNVAPDNNDTFTIYRPDGVQMQQANVSHWNSLATVALPLIPTTAGRTLDVSAGGEAGVDWANVGSPTTTVGLSGTTVKTATDVETDTQDIQARLPAALTAGGNIKAGVQGFLDSVFTEGAAGRITAAVKQFFNIGSPAATMDHGILVDTVTTYTGDTPQTGDAYARIGANGAGLTALATQASVNTVDDFLDTEIADIQARLPAALVSGRIDASVGAMASGVVTATAIAANAIGASELASDAVDKIVDGVWDEDVDSGHQTAGTAGKKLDDAGAAADPWATALPGAYGAGTAGKIIGDNVNATISSRSTLTAAQANTEADTALSDVGLTATITGRIDAAVTTRATPAQVNTEVLDCLVTDTHAEVSAVPAATSSLKDKICWLFALGRNKLTQSSSVQTLRNDADNASIATAAVSDSGTVATRDEWA